MYLTEAQTERLLIRPLQTADTKAWEAFFVNNPNLPILGLDDDRSVQQKAQDWIAAQHKRYEENRFGHMALVHRETDRLIGQCGLLLQEVEGRPEIEIGYHILPEYWKQGYASEAAQFFRHYAFGNGISDSLISIIHLENVGSQKVAMNNGMRKTIVSTYREKPVDIFRIDKEEYTGARLLTPRLLLREFTPADAPLLTSLNSDPEVIRYTGDGHVESEAEALRIIEEIILPQYANRIGRWAVHLRDTREFIGWCGLKQIGDEIDLGYRFYKQHWGQGYATEAAKACLRYGLNEMRFPQVIAKAMYDNHGSIRVMQKIGMRYWKELAEDDRHTGVCYEASRNR